MRAHVAAGAAVVGVLPNVRACRTPVRRRLMIDNRTIDITSATRHWHARSLGTHFTKITNNTARAAVVEVPVQERADSSAVHGPFGAGVLASAVNARAEFRGTRAASVAAGAAVVDVGQLRAVVAAAVSAQCCAIGSAGAADGNAIILCPLVATAADGFAAILLLLLTVAGPGALQPQRTEDGAGQNDAEAPQ